MRPSPIMKNRNWLTPFVAQRAQLWILFALSMFVCKINSIFTQKKKTGRPLFDLFVVRSTFGWKKNERLHVESNTLLLGIFNGHKMSLTQRELALFVCEINSIFTKKGRASWSTYLEGVSGWCLEWVWQALVPIHTHPAAYAAVTVEMQRPLRYMPLPHGS